MKLQQSSDICKRNTIIRTFATLWVNSADDKLMAFFLIIFSHKTGLTFHANCLQWRQFVWNVKSFADNLYEMPKSVSGNTYIKQEKLQNVIC